MIISEKSAKELIELAKSKEFKKDMELMKKRWQNPFVRDGEIDIDAYIEFVSQFNEFINHELKPFKPMIDKDMRL